MGCGLTFDSYGLQLDCFALSGAVGSSSARISEPNVLIALRQTMRDSLKFTLIYVSIAWLLLAITSHWIARAFDAQGMAEDVIVFFCVFIAGSFLLMAACFVANAAFNNLVIPCIRRCLTGVAPR